jgi:hypothetical protein
MVPSVEAKTEVKKALEQIEKSHKVIMNNFIKYNFSIRMMDYALVQLQYRVKSFIERR